MLKEPYKVQNSPSQKTQESFHLAQIYDLLIFPIPGSIPNLRMSTWEKGKAEAEFLPTLLNH